MRDRLGRWGRRVGLATLALAVLAGTAGAQHHKPAPPRTHVSAPEVNPGATLGAVALLAGCVLILTDRARRP
jgi:hypothetical protein